MNKINIVDRAIRKGDLDETKRLVESTDGQRLALAKNYFGRTALHIAVLKEREDIVYYLATKIKASLRLGDNVRGQAVFKAHHGLSNCYHYSLVGAYCTTLCNGRQ